MSSEQPVIHWFRRDLRLEDNLALQAALDSGAPVVPVFVFDTTILASDNLGRPRLKFMLHALAALDAALRERGARLHIRRGDPVQELADLAAQTDARALYYNRDYSPYAVQRDMAVEAALTVSIHAFDDALLLPPGAVLKDDGDPYVVYTPFKNRWKAQHKPASVTLTPGRFHTLPGDNPLPTLAELGLENAIDVPHACEAVAQGRLRYYTSGPIYAYADVRNNLMAEPFADDNLDGTSCLSPYLRLGLLSPRQAYWAARSAYDQAETEAARKSVQTWVDELIWREFYMHILALFPHVYAGNFRSEYDDLDWRDAPDDLAAWQAGLTGYPVVDAAMRQLKQIGWMPNRARMIVASFLAKDLLINWREGERHFMRYLIDGDPAANNGGWQWAAGTGTDAQPYFRIFNPVSQSEKFDPNGDYIRYWVPELRDVPVKHIHAPWTLDRPPQDYPARIVDHSAARERALAAFKVVK